MKKKALLFTSIGALFLVGVSAVAISGVNQLDRLQVKADPIVPTEYSVTFNESNTTVEDLDGNYAFGTTTAAGTKVGVVGWNNDNAYFTFNKVSFMSFMLSHYDLLTEAEGAYPFSTITGFAISFSGDDLVFRYDHEGNHEMIGPVESGTPYKGLSITPYDEPEFMAMGENVIVSSLTIWYSC